MKKAIFIFLSLGLAVTPVYEAAAMTWNLPFRKIFVKAEPKPFNCKEQIKRKGRKNIIEKTENGVLGIKNFLFIGGAAICLLSCAALCLFKGDDRHKVGEETAEQRRRDEEAARQPAQVLSFIDNRSDGSDDTWWGWGPSAGTNESSNPVADPTGNPFDD
ncbi:MAG: hypothetical protein LBL71_02870 [Endomicrobium sp.]|jgi:hypothetical protein|nr:hypothetical protein [Endomicrobium sp.]